MSYFPCFNDGKRTIDFILVYKSSALNSEIITKHHENFLKTLETLGVEFEAAEFSVNPDVIFIKVHLTDECISTFAPLFDIDLAYNSFAYRPYVPPPKKWLSTALTRPNPNDPDYARAPETFSGEIPKSPTSGERIMIVKELLNRCVWGERRGNYGIERLIKAGVFIDAFPLHDGDFKWTDSGPLNDRQILARYWGSAQNWTKAQPLTLVEKYFGTEFALYFAWLGMYISALIPASFLSVFVILYGVLTMFTELNNQGNNICKSDIIMCPRCHFKECPMELLSNSCYIAKATYLFDNWVTVLFAGIMSLWSTIFIEFWQREEAVLGLKWNLRSLETAVTLRPQFLEKATKMKYSPVTERMEPYIPKKKLAVRYMLTFVSLFLLLLIMLAATFGVMIYRLTVNVVLMKTHELEVLNNKYKTMVASITGAVISGVFIFIFKWVYEKIAIGLTDMEHHRSHHAYNNAYIFKSYAMAFANNYAALFYIAFFKGKFYTHPGDLENFKFVGGINTDQCDPSGCVVDLAILLIIIMVMKALVSNVCQVVLPKLVKFFKFTEKRVASEAEIPQWENEYLLPETEDFFIVGEYMDMVIQYGFVNFFVMGFPLAPLLALLNNLGEIRVDASKVTKSYRRPVPVKSTGLGAWLGILTATTYIGVVTNALVIAFTSNFMDNAIFTILHGSLSPGLLNMTLSVYDMKDFHLTRSSTEGDIKQCYYQGKRYPPDHPKRYQRRDHYWRDLAIKFACVVIFEHIVVIVKGVVAYAIPDVPFSVRQQVMHDEQQKKKARIRDLNQQYMKRRRASMENDEQRRKSVFNDASNN
ncbi:anoctamin-3-like [Anthonomus grandis grandis]|uniref:anoctamin-3-like n=1 Tax=Anthonomus grandis grandis TaxID=2921223 RepID=UPI002165EE99|nr:anoctamin-3-like [Anthonomus grandis grandis]